MTTPMPYRLSSRRITSDRPSRANFKAT
jgi:hypothetical protein